VQVRLIVVVFSKHWKKYIDILLKCFSPCSFSYLPWFEVYYKLLNTLADYLAKEQVILDILFLCVKYFS